MAFDIAAIKRELDAAPPAADLPWAVAVAVVSDTFRLAGLVPPVAQAWDAWRRKWPRAEELLPELARALAATSLRAETVRALEASRPAAKGPLEGFFDASVAAHRRDGPDQRLPAGGVPAPLDPPLRRARSTARPSDSRGSDSKQLDYREALAEYKKAEAARKSEAARQGAAAARGEGARGVREGVARVKEPVAAFERRTGERYDPPDWLRALGEPLSPRESCPTLFRFPGPEGLQAHFQGRLRSPRAAGARPPLAHLAAHRRLPATRRPVRDAGGAAAAPAPALPHPLLHARPRQLDRARPGGRSGRGRLDPAVSRPRGDLLRPHPHRGRRAPALREGLRGRAAPRRWTGSRPTSRSSRSCASRARPVLSGTGARSRPRRGARSWRDTACGPGGRGLERANTRPGRDSTRGRRSGAACAATSGTSRASASPRATSPVLRACGAVGEQAAALAARLAALRGSLWRSPYYLAVLRQHGLSPADLRTLDDLPHFPLLDRDTLRDSFAEIPALPAPAGRAPAGRAQLRQHRPAGPRPQGGLRHRSHVGGPALLDAVAAPLPAGAAEGRARLHAAPRRRVRDAAAGPRGRDARPDLDRPPRPGGAPPRFPPARRLLGPGRPALAGRPGAPAAAEAAPLLGDAPLAPPAPRVEGTLQAPVVNYYATSETGPIAWECLAVPGCFHVLLPDVWVESVDGELVVTRLRASILPLLRYRTGDRGEVGRDDCRCGYGGATIRGLTGRRACAFLAPGGREVDAWQLAWAFRHHPLDGFRLTQEGPEAFRLETTSEAGRSRGPWRLGVSRVVALERAPTAWSRRCGRRSLRSGGTSRASRGAASRATPWPPPSRRRSPGHSEGPGRTGPEESAVPADSSSPSETKLLGMTRHGKSRLLGMTRRKTSQVDEDRRKDVA